MSRRDTIALIALVLLAIAVRVPGLSWGFNTASGEAFAELHPDEPRFVEIALGLHHDTPFRKSYVLGLGQALRVVIAVNELLGHEMDRASMFLALRLMSLSASVLLVPLLAAIALRLGLPSSAALAAAALQAVNSLAATNGHYGTADSIYTTLLVACTWVILAKPDRTGSVALGLLAGLAMATKFGVVLLPAVLVLTVLQPGGLLILPTAVATFLAAQGFAFDGESVRAILESFTVDNAAQRDVSRLWNIPVFAAVLLRSMGMPAFAFAIVALARRTRSGTLPHAWRTWIAFSPLLLHAAGLLLITLQFPRHALPLVPLLCLAAGVLLASRPRWATFAVAWSLALCAVDQAAFVSDTRDRAALWMTRNPAQGLTWGDRYAQRGLAPMLGTTDPTTATRIVLHEGWTYRFRASEINPASPPRGGLVYHATEQQIRWHSLLHRAKNDGFLVEQFKAEPLALLPEQLLFRNLWGSFEKFAGSTLIWDVRRSRTGP